MGTISRRGIGVKDLGAALRKAEASLPDAQGLVLTIWDNGMGISKEEKGRPKSLGLVGMRERALIFGGTLEIKGQKGPGTMVLLRLPL
jgi:signal transduction histidine kinase